MSIAFHHKINYKKLFELVLVGSSYSRHFESMLGNSYLRYFESMLGNSYLREY